MQFVPKFVRVIDIESTGLDPAVDQIIEAAWVDVFSNGFISDPCQVFVAPTVPISIEAMAVHHLTEADVMDGIRLSDLRNQITSGDPIAYVAHNSKFEESFMPWLKGPWIDTYRCALRLWPEAPKHSNQVLRYFLCLNMNQILAMPPHRAAPDAYVTAHIFAKMLALEGENRLRRLVAWSKEPGLLPRVNFGKHRGSAWADVPTDYLEWIGRQPDMDEDIRFTAHTQNENRKEI